MLTAVIVDDEPKAIEGLSWELTNFSQEIEIIKTFSIPEEALVYLSNNKPDCLFLDIQMPELSGVELAKLLPEHIKIIFTSGYSEATLEGLNLDEVDYLLKPITFERFYEAVQKVKGSLQNNS